MEPAKTPEHDSEVSREESREETPEESPDESPAEDPKLPPVDKGYAWVVCAGVVLMMFATWGVLMCFGVYISFWLNHDTFHGANSVNYALTSSMVNAVGLVLSPISMIVYNLVGFKITAAIGILLYFAGFMLCSFSTRLWELYLTQGLMVGMGFALLSNPCSVILSQWFQKYRALSSGMMTAGVGAGGIVFSLASQALISRQNDFRWAIRMLAIVTFALNIVVGIVVHERIPTKHVCSWAELKKQSNIILNFKSVKHWQVFHITLWYAFALTAYLVLNYTLSSFATFIGLSQEIGANMTAVFNACQIVGRIAIGYTGEKCGRVNTAVTLNFMIIVIIFAFFINVTTYASLIAFSVVGGLTTGWSQVLYFAILPDSVTPEEYPSVWSYSSIVVGLFTLYGPVSALKLRTVGAERPFLHAQIFSGSLVCASTVFIIIIREWKVRRVLSARQEEAKDEKDEKIDAVLKPGVGQYLRRLFYPIKV